MIHWVWTVICCEDERQTGAHNLHSNLAFLFSGSYTAEEQLFCWSNYKKYSLHFSVNEVISFFLFALVCFVLCAVT